MVKKAKKCAQVSVITGWRAHAAKVVEGIQSGSTDLVHAECMLLPAKQSPEGGWQGCLAASALAGSLHFSLELCKDVPFVPHEFCSSARKQQKHCTENLTHQGSKERGCFLGCFLPSSMSEAQQQQQVPESHMRIQAGELGQQREALLWLSLLLSPHFSLQSICGTHSEAMCQCKVAKNHAQISTTPSLESSDGKKAEEDPS